MQLAGGLLEVDPRWRERRLLAQLEPARLGRKQTRAEFLAGLSCETGIFFVSGRPGGGKSMLATKLIVDELVNGHRPVVTNLALNLARLQEYLFELGADVHVLERVRLLGHEESFEFYRYRGADLVLPLLKVDGSAWRKPDQETLNFEQSQNDGFAAGGIFYVLDECHNYISTKAKVDEDSPLFQWASQHRKLKDSCYLVTQSIEHVHAKVRRLAQSFIYVRNMRREKYRGFTRGDGFDVSIFPFIPSDADKRTLAPERYPLKLDVRGLASCYFTAGGVGVAAVGTGDGGFAKKGLNIKWMWVSLLVMVLVGLSCAIWVPKIISHVVTGQGAKVANQISGVIKAKNGVADPGHGKEAVASSAAGVVAAAGLVVDQFYSVGGVGWAHIKNGVWARAVDHVFFVEMDGIGRVDYDRVLVPDVSPSGQHEAVSKSAR